MPDTLNPFAAPQTSATTGPEVVWATEHPQALRRVKLGLTLVYCGICGILLASLAMPLLFMFVAKDAGPAHIAVLSIVLGGVMILLSLLIFAGEVLCIAVPAESGAKRLVILSVVLQALAFAISLISTGFLQDSSAAGVVSLAGNAIGTASLVCFLLFLRKLALFLNRFDLAGRAARALAVGVIAAAVLGGSMAVMMADPMDINGLTGKAAFGVMIGGLGSLVALVMYANTVTYLRKAITV